MDFLVPDIFLVEAIVNGILLGGILALLALGLNLIFGVIDVVWISYAELVMCGMYAIYWLYAVHGVPLPIAAVIAIVFVAILGVLVHKLIISPILGSAPINQLLATGGLLFFLQSFATLLFGADFRNIGLRLPIIEVGDLFISFARLLAFGAALLGMIGLWLFLKRTYVGTAIRAIAQDREIMILMGSTPSGSISSPRHWAAAWRAWRRRCWCCNTTCTLHRPVLRADHLHDLRAGRARQHDRRLRRRLHHEPDHLGRRFLHLDRAVLRAGLPALHRDDLRATAGPVWGEVVKAGWILLGLALLLPPFLPISDYTLHILILILLWAFVYTSWTVMGRFGLVSLGHGAFLGLGTYATALLWNHYGLSPWLGLPLGIVVAVVVALVIGYPARA